MAVLLGWLSAASLAAQTSLPTLASISPPSGYPGTAVSVTLKGANFTAQSGVRLAGGGAAQGNVVVVDSTTITATFTLSSSVATGPHNVYIVTSAGSSNILPFTVVPAPVSVTVTPSAASLYPSGAVSLAASVSNASNADVTWSLTPNLGSLTVSGASASYSAPSSIPSPQSVTAIATSAADPTKSAYTTLQLLPAISVMVSPAAVTLEPGDSAQFSASVQGTTNPAVTWSIQPNVGTISNTGVYTAPLSSPAQQTVTITASSAQNPAASSSAQVTIKTGVTVTMGSSGLTSLAWNGQNMLYAPMASPGVAQVFQTDPTGKTTGASTKPTATSINSGANTITQTYPWGVVATQYRAAGTKLIISVTIQNNTPNTIGRYWMYPTGLQFPAIPSNASNNAAFNIDAPSSIWVNYAGGAVDLVNEDVCKPLALGLWQATSPAAASWLISLYVDPGQNLNASWPAINRPIAPGASENFTISLRFGAAGATEQQLAGDIFSLFASTYNRQPGPVNTHKPIARLSFNSSYRPTLATNPRGWFNDPKVDVTTSTGIAAFQSRLLAGADTAITEMQRVGASGAILWDMEGQQYDQSYIGDPSVAEMLAPELVGVFDTFVNKFKSAGFAIGFTLRPQAFTLQTGTINVSGTTVTWAGGAQFSSAWAGQPGGGEITIGARNYVIASVQSPTMLTLSASAGALTGVPYSYGLQTNVADPETEMKAKVQYAVNRWGASLFYVDSDLTYSGSTITPAQVFKDLTVSFPGVTFFPEWKNTGHYAYTYPFLDATNGITAPPTKTMYVYPQAGGLVRVPGDAQMASAEAALLNSVNAGNILLFDGWYRHPANDIVIQIYQQVH
ncbi:MAG TPA: hypothetical protein VKB79_13790 [Bryobacteraceae bacterium]|nr:hypothetical protein [Bryobacteraceae bacterium]